MINNIFYFEGEYDVFRKLFPIFANLGIAGNSDKTVARRCLPFFRGSSVVEPIVKECGNTINNLHLTWYNFASYSLNIFTNDDSILDRRWCWDTENKSNYRLKLYFVKYTDDNKIIIYSAQEATKKEIHHYDDLHLLYIADEFSLDKCNQYFIYDINKDKVFVVNNWEQKFYTQEDK